MAGQLPVAPCACDLFFLSSSWMPLRSTVSHWIFHQMNFFSDLLVIPKSSNTQLVSTIRGSHQSRLSATLSPHNYGPQIKRCRGPTAWTTSSGDGTDSDPLGYLSA